MGLDPKLLRGLKEVRDALIWIAVLLAILGLLWALSGCTYWRAHPTEIRAWAAYEVGKPVVGHNPTGNILVTQPLPAYLELSYNHQSSIPDYYDLATVDQFGVGFCIKVPLRRCD